MAGAGALLYLIANRSPQGIRMVFQSLDPANLRAMLDGAAPPQLIDVRSAAEVARISAWAKAGLPVTA